MARAWLTLHAAHALLTLPPCLRALASRSSCRSFLGATGEATVEKGNGPRQYVIILKVWVPRLREY